MFGLESGAKRRRVARFATCALLVGLAAAPTGAGAEPLPGAPPLPAAQKAALDRALASLGADYVPRTRHRLEDGSPRYTNRLILETSPYLKQHAHNPVDWYPWGDEAFEVARRLNRPVLVSIGYSTCHWCHVMEEESFDDPEIARILNEGFVAIKVDRESRPDVDAIYMTALQAMGQGGGWPLNVWLTPDRKPFYGGTYFPPRSMRGRPSFESVLSSISERWREDAGSLRTLSVRLTEVVAESLEGEASQSTPMIDASLLERARKEAIARIDRRAGGTGQRTKFPSSTPIRFLLREHRRTGDTEALSLAVLTLEQMARGGIYDQIGGGFHRYATDAAWRIPHFEKMLYDNALLVPAYLEASQITGREDLARIAREIVDYVLREMTAPEGAFYSATDADSPNPGGELEEGWFFTWTPAELDAVLGTERARRVAAWYGVESTPELDGRHVLHRSRSPADVAASFDLSPDELSREVASARQALYAARQRRPAPLLDDKILVAWNGLMISAAAQAGFVLGEPRYIEAAAKAADFILRSMRTEGRLQRVHHSGRASGPAFLADYAFLIAGLLDLYEADPDPRWLREAIALQAVQDQWYADSALGGYFETAHDGEALLARSKPHRDGAEPSGNSVAALNLLRLAEFTQRPEYHERAIQVFSSQRSALEEQPTSLSVLLLAADFVVDQPFEIVLVAPEDQAGQSEMLAALRQTFVPNRIVAVVTEGASQAEHASVVPLVANKRALRGETTAYVCVNRVCAYPTSDPKRFAGQIAEVADAKSGPSSTPE